MNRTELLDGGTGGFNTLYQFGKSGSMAGETHSFWPGRGLDPEKKKVLLKRARHTVHLLLNSLLGRNTRPSCAGDRGRETGKREGKGATNRKRSRGPIIMTTGRKDRRGLSLTEMPDSCRGLKMCATRATGRGTGKTREERSLFRREKKKKGGITVSFE